MYQKIKELNKVIDDVIIELDIKTESYTSDDIYRMFMNNKLMNILDNTFKNCKFVEKRDLNICNKFHFELIKVYLELNTIELRETKSNDLISELKYYSSNYKIYSAEMSKYKFLSKEKERELLIDYKINNNQKSKEILICSYQKLILSIAKKWTNDEHLLMDLIQVGNIGLLHSLNAYDINYNITLGVFAIFPISNMISRFYNKYKYSDMYGYDVMELKHKIDKYNTKYENLYGKLPTEEEILKEFGISKNRLESAKKVKIVESLDDIILLKENDEECFNKIFEKTFLLDDIENDFYKKIDNKLLLDEFIDMCKEILNEKEFYVVTQFLGIGTNSKMQIDIAEELGVKRQYISEIYKKALYKIKNNKKVKRLARIYFED